jgi:hypothetical protein
MKNEGSTLPKRSFCGKEKCRRGKEPKKIELEGRYHKYTHDKREERSTAVGWV